MNALYFAKSLNGMIPRGSILSKEPTASNSIPVIAKEFEVFNHENQSYLLADKEPLEFTGSIQTQAGSELYFKKSNVTYRYDQNLELQEVSSNWLTTGTRTNQGTVIEIGDEVAVCENGHGKKPYFKKSLLPIENEIDVINQEIAALEYQGRLRKALAGTTTAPAASITPGIKQGTPKWRVSFASQKAQIVPSQEHTEGEIRQFSPSDTRQLTRAKSGMLRWVSVDEKVKLQQAKQKAMANESKGKERQKYEEGTKNKGTLSKIFRIGKEILVGGAKAKVVDYGDDIVAVKKPDGSTGTIRASEYSEGHSDLHNIPITEKPKESPEETAKEEIGNRENQKKLDTDLHEDMPRNKYYSEQQAIIKEQSAIPEYQTFQDEQSKDGWTKDIATPFRFVKDISFVSSLGNLRSGTAEKVWRPEKKDYDYYFEGQAFDVSYQGKQYNIVGMADGNIDIRDQFGNKQTIKNNDLDQYKGQIILDADGNARIKNAEGEEFSLELIEGLTQEDLFKEGTVKIIKDEVWKSIKSGEGAVVDDVKLGKIRRGIAFYKHGDETGIVDENKHEFQVSKSDAKRDLPEPDDKLKTIQKEVQKAKAKLDKHNLERQDVETVKARIEHGNANVPYASKQKELQPEKYKDVFDQWLKDGGEGIDEQIAGSYTNPDEWKANVLSLAERMKVEDVKRTSEVTALNDFAKTGVVIEPPKPREMNEYVETAKDILMSRRKDFLQKKKSERVEAEREGEIPAKFEWDAPAELPSADTGAIVSDNVKIIRDSRNDSYQVQYAFVPKQSVMVSHSIEGETNPEHPSELQAREREKDVSSSLQMREIAKNPNEELVEDNKDATRGAPVAYSKEGKTYIVQGNGRTGAVLGMEGAAKEKYFGMMLQKAKELGIPTDKVNENMMLVRVMSPVHTYEDARKLGAFGQKSSALPMTEVEEARSFQNAQRLKFGLNLNLTGIGRRSINEKNVGTFIRNNPQVYQKILKLSGYDPVAVQYRPAEQAKVVNTALLAQLDKDFIRTVSRKGEDTHELVKVTAPIIADNQKDIADGSVPPNGDIQKFLKNAIDHYDGLNSTTKNLLKVDKNGNIPFLETGDEGRKNPDSLISRMRQEAIEFGDKKSGNIFRNPLNVIGMVAYNQAMTPRDPDKKDQARELFALKMKRFADAMKTLKESKQQGGDIFAAQLSEEEQTRQQQEDIIKIAERVFLENKPYREENAEEMTAEEKEAGKETYSAFNAYKKMKDVAKEFEFDLEHHKLRKSLLSYFFKSLIQKHHNEVELFKSQQTLFGNEPIRAPKSKKEYKPDIQVGDPQAGQIKKFAEGDTRILKPATTGKLRWFDYAGEQKKKEIGLFENIPEAEPAKAEKKEEAKEPRKKVQLDGRKIKRIIDVVDTREYELIGSEHGKDIFKPITGSGRINQCDRCGKDHEIHATVELDDKSEIVVGTGCMKAEFGKLAEVIGIMANTVTTIKKHESKIAKLDDEEKELNQAWEKIEKLDVPLDKITFETKDTEDGHFTIARMDGAMVFVHGDKSKFDDERKKTLVEDWKTNKLSEILKQKFPTSYEAVKQRIDRQRSLTEQSIEKLNKKLEVAKKDFASNPDGSLKKSISNFFSFFKSQMDMFGTPKPKQQSGQLSWKSLGQEKPNHKYIRRERGKSGEWVYYYKDAQGREFKGDAKGKELPKHHDWQEGDTVIHDSKKYKLGEFGDNIAQIEDQAGNKKVVRIAELTHEAEHQKKLVNEHETKWDRLVSALESDLQQFDNTGKSEHFPEDTKLELQRKLKYAKEERDQRKGQTENKIEIPEFHSTEEAIAFGDKATPEQVKELKRLREETLAEGKKLFAEKKMQEATNIAVKAQFYREATEAYEKKPGSSVSTNFSKKPDQTETPEFKLAEESKKYKSAKEFVKAKSNVFHGTLDKDFKLDSNKPIFLTDDFDNANTYAGYSYNQEPEGKVISFHAKEGKTLDLKNIENVKKAFQDMQGSSTLKKIYDEIPSEYEAIDRHGEHKTLFPKQRRDDFENWIDLEHQTKPEMKNGLKVLTGSYSFDKSSQEARKNLQEAFNTYGKPSRQSVYNRWSDLQKYAKEKGYDYIDHTTESPDASILFSEKIALNPQKSLLTESQLTDIWNKSNKKLSKSIISFFKQLTKARKETDTNPTEAQKEQGNYSKGTVEIHGLEIAIENPKGTIRSGKDRNNKEWHVTMPVDYGYFKVKDENGVQIKGKDKDEIDVFIGNTPTSEKVFIVNQIVPSTKEHDEHKALICFKDKRRALRAYKRSYTDNATKRIGSVVEMTIDEFNDWLKNEDKNKYAEDHNGKGDSK